MAIICNKPKGTCVVCEHYKFDSDRNNNACFATNDINNATFDDYKKAIAIDEIELAQRIYSQVFRK